ncbi:hypothetical protein ACFYXH_41225 [Streptomyces sp. NPDC002730]|uniref:hypothetical protein n=1 Tax=Streptomyces sp. NPDC002730 TaxID=3364662 RepID=UPI0036AE95D6
MTTADLDALCVDVSRTLERAGFDIAPSSTGTVGGLRIQPARDDVLVTWNPDAELHAATRHLHSRDPGADDDRGIRKALATALVATLTQAGFTAAADEDSGAIHIPAAA